MFDRLNPRNADDYYTMLCVYDYMNGLDDDYLEANDFTREEIEDGVQEITGIYDTEGLYRDCYM